VPLAMQLFFGLVSADGGADAWRVLGGSDRDWRMGRLLTLCRLPGIVRQTLAWGIDALGQRRTAQMLRSIGARSADQFWQLSAQRAAYAERFFGAWQAARLDALICPPHALPALTHGSTEHLSLAGSYGYWANVLGVPAGVVPVTRVLPGEESDRPASRDVVDRAARRVETGSTGLPVGVQVAARPWREDVVLSVMAALEQHFQSHPNFPSTPVQPPPLSVLSA